MDQISNEYCLLFNTVTATIDGLEALVEQLKQAQLASEEKIITLRLDESKLTVYRKESR